MRKTRIFSLIIATIMILGTMTTTVFAEDAVAEITGTTYTSIYDAISEAKDGDTIKLLSDIEVASRITIEKAITLDGDTHTITITNDSRGIEIPYTVGAAEITIKNLTVTEKATNGWFERGINYNGQGTLNLESVTVAGPPTYAVNIPGKAIGATINITNCNLTGLNTVNVWGSNSIINITDTTIVSVDENESENYSAVKINNDNTTSAEGTVVNITGGSITANDEKENASNAISNATNTGVVNVSESTVVNGDVTNEIANIGGYTVSTLQDALDASAKYNVPAVLLRNVEITETVTVPAGKTVTLDLNGFTISGDFEESKSSAVIQNNGKLTIKDSSSAQTGKITSHAVNPDTQAIPGYASNTINNAGEFILESGIIENQSTGGACFAIDTTWYTKAVSVTINGGTVKANRTAIRAISYSTTVGNKLTINDGKIEGSCGVWIQLAGSNNEAKKVSVEINGGTINTNKADGYSVYTYSYGDAFSGVELTITDGNFNGYVGLGTGCENGGSGAEKVRISGGNFDQYVYNFNENAQDIEISGGTYSYVYEDMLADGFKLVANDNGTYGVKEDSPWTTATDSGYYMSAESKLGLMRYLFHFGIEGTIEDAYIKYIKGSDLSSPQAGEIAKGELTNTFYGDIVGVPENTTGRYYAIGYIKIDGKEYWSNPIFCEPNFTRHFSSMDNGGVE
ncbi:MAG: hypothetical protein J6D15_03750 [Clostridia bacterium]|nr:hypothetical protein [Clostridia bacterium]